MPPRSFARGASRPPHSAAGAHESPVERRLPGGGLVAALAGGTGLAAFVFYYLRGLTTVHYDAKAHLVIARRLVDALTPGYAQLGVHWLPLPHLLYAPLVRFDAQYRSALLPSLLSVLAFALSVWLTFRIAGRLTGDAAAGYAAAILLGLNANLLFVQSCPLTEPLFMALMLAATDALMIWRRRPGSGPPWAAALWTALAALCRYEGWYLLAGILVLVGWDALRRARPPGQSLRAAALFAVLFAVPAGLHFTIMFLGAGDTFLHRVVRGRDVPYETYRRPLLSIVYHLAELAQAAGFVPLVVALAGAAAWCLARGARERAPLWLLWLPSATNVSILAWGMIYRVRWSMLLLPAVAISTATLVVSRRASRRALAGATLLVLLLPWVSWWAPAEWRFHWLRPGPGIVLLPVVAVGCFLAGEARARQAWALVALLAVALELPVLEGEWRPVLEEALEHRFLDGEIAEVVGRLRAGYDGTRILADAGKLAPLVYDSGLPLREFVMNEGDPPRWHRALARPEAAVGWICALSGDEVWQTLQVDPHRVDRYSLAVKTEHFVLYRLRGGPTFPDRRDQ